MTVVDDAVAVMVGLTDLADQAMEHTRLHHAAAPRRTRDPDDADDLLQEPCLRAYRGFARFEQGTNLRGGLHRIRTNTFTSTARRRGRCSSNRSASHSRSFIGHIRPSCGVIHLDRPRLHGCDRFDRSRYVAGSGTTNYSKEKIMNVLVGASGAIGTRKDLPC